jgi:RNA polymerase sigma factor (sigma-70 family)
MSKNIKRSRPRGKRIILKQIFPLLPLIPKVIHTHFRWALARVNSGLYEIEDLHQEGILGIIRAIQKYDPKLGNLETYARWHIRGRIGRFLWQNSFPNIIIPRDTKTRATFLPIDERISKDHPPITNFISLRDYHKTTSDRERQASVRKLVLLVLKEIPSPKKRIISKYFGICTCKNNGSAHHHSPMTLRQIGKQRGLSRETIRRELRESLVRLKRKRNKAIRQIRNEWKSL